jgi:carboxylesterase
MGNPRLFDPFLALFEENGWDTQALVLPGHGGSAGDFAHASREVWLNYVEQKLCKLRKQYDHILLVGHSMGCLLSFIACAHCPDQIIGIVSLAVPLHLHPTRQAMRMWYHFALRHFLDDPYLEAAKKFNGVTARSFIDYLVWFPRYIDLFSLIRQTRSILSRVHVPTLIFYFDRDEYIRVNTLDFIRTNLTQPKPEIYRFSRSSHYYFPLEDQKLMEQRLVAFITSLHPPLG